MTPSKVLATLLFIVLLFFGVSGCSASAPSGQLGQLGTVAASCPANSRKLASFGAIDGSGSSSDSTISKQRLAIIKTVVTRTVVCGGHLQIVAFAGSSGSNATIYDAEIPTLPGATQIARLRHAQPAIDSVMGRITKAIAPAMKTLPKDGSDIVAEFRLAAEYKQSLGSGYQLDVSLLTDGFQNISFDLQSKALSPTEASALAKSVPMPNIKGASVTIAGLGQTSDGSPASSDVVAGLVSFYTDLCQQTHAAHCLAVTTLPEGR